MRVQDGVGGPRYEAFGAAPGQSWASLSGTWSDLEAQADDYLLVQNGDGSEVRAFSGIAGGVWEPVQLFAGLTHYGSPTPDSVALVLDGFSCFWGFSPARSQWTMVNPGNFGTPFLADSVLALFSTFLPLTSFSARWGTWNSGPMLQSAATGVGQQGSLIFFHEQSGPSANRISVFDERCGAWSQFNPGYFPVFRAGDNLLVLHPNPATGMGSEVHAFSLQTGAWTGPPAGAVSLPVLAAPEPEAEENVAFLADSGGLLWAYGSPNAGHVWHQWPNGTEYHVIGPVPGGAALPTVGYSVRAGVDKVVFGFLAGDKTPQPAIFPGVAGGLALDLVTLVQLGDLGQVGPTGVVPLRFPVQGIVPAGVQPFWQPAILDFFQFTAEFPDRSDPSWFF